MLEHSSINKGLASHASLPVFMSLSVIQPSADTTTIAGSDNPSTIFFTLVKLSIVPTDVPPNLSTFIKINVIYDCNYNFLLKTTAKLRNFVEFAYLCVYKNI